MKSKEYKLDIFDCLLQIDKKNIHFYDNLPADKQKAFMHVVIMRWLYGSPHDLQTILLNRTVNPFIFTLGKHPSLLYKLMTTTAVQIKTTYRWKPKPRDLALPISLNIVAKFYEISKREARLHLSNFSAEDILNMGEDIGMQIEEIKKLKLELKKI